MAFSISNRKTEKVSLPSFEGATATVYTSLLVSEQKEITKKYPKADDGMSDDAQSASAEMILKGIVSWDFEEEITIENINKLPMVDAFTILEKITGRKILEEGGIGEPTNAKKK